MPRKLRLEYSGAIYHVMNRGDPRETHSSQGAGEGLMQQRLFQRRQRRLLLLVEAREALGFDGEGRPRGLPQRGKGIQPRVARNELPRVSAPKYAPNPNGVASSPRLPVAATPMGLMILLDDFPG